MFGKSGKTRTEITTLVGAGTRIFGDIEFEGGLHLDGQGRRRQGEAQRRNGDECTPDPRLTGPPGAGAAVQGRHQGAHAVAVHPESARRSTADHGPVEGGVPERTRQNLHRAVPRLRVPRIELADGRLAASHRARG